MSADNFDRANGPLGANWTDVFGRWFGVFSNTALCDGNLAPAYYNAEPRAADQWARCKIVTQIESASGQGGGPAVRIQPDGSCYSARVNAADGVHIFLTDLVGNQFVTLATFACVPDFGDVFEIRAVGNIISVFQNGVFLGQVEDDTIADGEAGIIGRSFNANTFLDDWESGDVVVDPGGAAAITGTGAGGLTGEQIRTDGTKTLITTLTDDTFAATDLAAKQAIVDGWAAAGNPTWGWNAVKAQIDAATAVAFTGDTVATLTIPALPDYQSDADEELTQTIDGAILTGGEDIVATPTVTISKTVTDVTPVDVYDMTGSATRARP